MRTYAEVNNGVVVILGTWDETVLGPDWFPQFIPPTIAVEVTLDTRTPQPGWGWDGTIFSPPPPPSAGEIQQRLINAVQFHLDKTAQTRNYDGILSLCSYATSTNTQFKTEGQAGVQWRDDCWAHCYQVMADVQAQTRTIPTPAELVAELPAMTWGA